MFESSLITFLRADPVLAALVSTFESAAAIFTEEAPEEAHLPYSVVRIEQFGTESPAVHRFSVFIDYFDDNKSRVNSRKAAARIELLLDRKHLDHERYGKIRLFYFDGQPIQTGDPRIIHYSLQFEARAGRKAFAEYQTTLET
jgi:hypothetical protein